MPRRRERHIRDESDYSEGETPPRCRGRHKSRRGVKRRKHRDRNRHRHHHRRKRDREPSPTPSYSYGYDDSRSPSPRGRKGKAIRNEAEEFIPLNQLNEDVPPDCSGLIQKVSSLEGDWFFLAKDEVEREMLRAAKETEELSIHWAVTVSKEGVCSPTGLVIANSKQKILKSGGLDLVLA